MTPQVTPVIKNVCYCQLDTFQFFTHKRPDETFNFILVYKQNVNKSQHETRGENRLLRTDDKFLRTRFERLLRKERDQKSAQQERMLSFESFVKKENLVRVVYLLQSVVFA